MTAASRAPAAKTLAATSFALDVATGEAPAAGRVEPAAGSPDSSGGTCNGRSVAIPAAVIDDGRISLEAFWLFAKLALHADQTGRCRITAIRIAAARKVSSAAVKSSLAELEAAGYVRVSRRPGLANAIELTGGAAG